MNVPKKNSTFFIKKVLFFTRHLFTFYEFCKLYLILLKGVATGLPSPLSNYHHICGHDIGSNSFIT